MASKIRQLIEFEEWCEKTYLQGKIRSPIHLSGGNETPLINIFKKVKKDDWIFTTYRSHYHTLLKGVPDTWLKKWILKNKSIHVMNKKHRIVTSAIVGGTLTQAVGTALSIKLSRGKNHVWCFCGDMTASLGVFKDCVDYCEINNLPITFVIEDNEMSTDTPSALAWGHSFEDELSFSLRNKYDDYPNVLYYKYKRTYPHYGIGKFIDFDMKT